VASRQLRETNPDVLLFASSGYSDDPVMARPEDYGFADSLRKPYLMSDLMEMLNTYLLK
jgi:two-component system cell cycle sensor histidine kinase/response regulator CckA